MDALGSLEDIAEQTSCRVDVGTRQRRTKCKWGHALPANLTRSKVAREKKPQPKPIEAKPPSEPPQPRSPASAKLGRAFSDYRTLVEIFRSRAAELELSRAELDRISGAPAGYAGKLLGEKAVRKIGSLSLELMLGALGLKLVVIEDEAATARTLAQRVPVDKNQQRFGNVSRTGSVLALPPPSSQPASPLLTVVPAKRSARGSKYG